MNFSKIYKNTFFYRTHPVGTSGFIRWNHNFPSTRTKETINFIINLQINIIGHYIYAIKSFDVYTLSIVIMKLLVEKIFILVKLSLFE